MKILIIEDDRETAVYIADGLSRQGHAVERAEDGEEGLFLATSQENDLIIIDRRLPRMDGLSVVKAIRAAGLKVPILFLTTISTVEERVAGLEAGGDDYLVKPFHFSELLARANALLRRPPINDSQAVLRVADLEMNLLLRKVYRGGVEIELLPREFELLHYMVRNADRVVTRTMLLEHVWDFHFDPKTSVVETHISRLRAKVDKPFERPLIHTIQRAGYSLHG